MTEIGGKIMRLIDADTLIKDLSYLYTKNRIPVDMRAKETLSTIMEQPTAYDVDKNVKSESSLITRLLMILLKLLTKRIEKNHLYLICWS